MTLTILAAGLGSRYGGLKQLDPITPNGQFIIDYSIFDALRAGIDRVVFIIKKENEELFRETIGDRIADYIKVEYAYQDVNMLPAGRTCSSGSGLQRQSHLCCGLQKQFHCLHILLYTDKPTRRVQAVHHFRLQAETNRCGKGLS